MKGKENANSLQKRACGYYYIKYNELMFRILRDQLKNT